MTDYDIKVKKKRRLFKKRSKVKNVYCSTCGDDKFVSDCGRLKCSNCNKIVLISDLNYD